MKKFTFLLVFLIFFSVSFWLSYEQKSSNYTDQKIAQEEVLAVSSPKISPNVKSPKAIYLKPSVASKVFKNNKVRSFKTKGIIAGRYLDPSIPKGRSNELFLEYWADPETIKSLRLREPLFRENKIDLLIQTYTWAPTGAAYGFNNFQFLEKPYKTRSGAYAYISRFVPPAAIIALPDDQRFLVLTAKNPQILFRALDSLSF